MEPWVDPTLVEQVAGAVARLLRESPEDIPKVGLELEWLSPLQAGAYLKLSARSLEALRAVGDGPKFYKYSGRVRYFVGDLRAWALEHLGR